jgi:sugar lactone lactonase YvrE
MLPLLLFLVSVGGTSPNCVFLSSVGTSGSGLGEFSAPYGISVDLLGNIYVAEQNNNRVQRFNNMFSSVGAFGSLGNGNGLFNAAQGLAIDTVGARLFVVDESNNRVQVFSTIGLFLFSFGSPGTSNGKFNLPSGIALDNLAVNVFVTDNNNCRVQVFLASLGTFVTSFGSSCGSGSSQFSFPCAVAVGSTGNVFVVDQLNNRVQMWSQFLGIFSYAQTIGFGGAGPGQLNSPSGITIDPISQNIFVVDSGNHRIQQFSSGGAFLNTFGNFGTGNGQFSNPIGIAMDVTTTVYVTDLINNRFQSFFCGTPLTQSISFSTLTPLTASVGGVTYTPVASATSGLNVTIAVSAASVSCSITGGVVSFVASGACILDANQGGSVKYNAAIQVQQSFFVAKGFQIVSFLSVAPAAAAVGGSPYVVNASATSGLIATISVDAVSATICNISSGVVSFIGAGSCVLNAVQLGNININASTIVQQAFSVAKGIQNLLFTSVAPASAKVSDFSYVASAVSSVGLPVVINVDPSAATICLIQNGVFVSFQGAGNCILNANQGGSANFFVSTQTQQVFSVAKGVQNVSFVSLAPAGAVAFGPTYSPFASATSGLNISITVNIASSSICSIVSGVVSFNATGVCILDALQPGDLNWLTSSLVQQSFGVGLAVQSVTITTGAPTSAQVGGSLYGPSAISTSGLAIEFSIDSAASSVCVMTDIALVSFVGSGLCILNANQLGNATFNAAMQVQQNFSVSPGVQTITFTSGVPIAQVAGSTYSPVATATSGLAVTISGIKSGFFFFWNFFLTHYLLCSERDCIFRMFCIQWSCFFRRCRNMSS